MSNVRYNKEDLTKTIQASLTWGEVCRKLELKPACGSQSHLKKRAIHFNIDFSHFTGQA
ncbi:hypothetical protein BH09PAT1_BH09PAT1_2800 [soil metagenome]